LNHSLKLLNDPNYKEKTPYYPLFVVTPEWFYHPLALFLNAFITPLFVTPEWFCEGSTVLKTSGFPIKNFGNDGGGGRHHE